MLSIDDNISFWKPVAMNYAENPGKSFFAKCAWVMGSLADQFISLSKTTLKVKAEWINSDQIVFESENKTAHASTHIILTSLKVAAVVAAAVFLPIPILAFTAVAFLGKAIFKKCLNDSVIEASKIQSPVTVPSTNKIFYEKQVGNSKIVLLYGSILDETTDLIVNAANPSLKGKGMGGICAAIYKAAGDEAFDECAQILTGNGTDHLNPGEAALSGPGNLAPMIKGIVHAVGPNFNDADEEANGWVYLANAYQNSLELAFQPQNHVNKMGSSFQNSNEPRYSIAFPSISTGIFSAPLDEAANVAMSTVKKFLESLGKKQPKEVRFVFLPNDPTSGSAYQTALEKL